MDGRIKARAIEVSNGRLLDKPFDDLELKRSLELALRAKSGLGQIHAGLAMDMAANS